MGNKYSIENYLRDTEFSAKTLITVISSAAKDKEVLEKTHLDWLEVEKKEDEVSLAEYGTAEYYSKRDESIAALHEFDKKYKHENLKVLDIVKIKGKYNDSLLAINGSLEALSSSLLQIAKQGISIAHGTYKNDCNKTGEKFFHSASLLDVIWEGRNQALHFEDGKFDEGVDLCFSELSSINNVFSDYKRKRNMAYEIVKLLNWTTYGEYYRDLMSLEKN